jgi:hypothetical protein
MKRFFAICSALVVGALLVGPVHAGPPKAKQRSGHQAGKRSGHHARHPAGRHWRTRRPRPALLPWQWLPEQVPGALGIDPNAGGQAPDGGTAGPIPVPSDPNAGGNPPGGDGGDGNAAQPTVPPRAGGQPRTPGPSNGTPPNSPSRPGPR